MRILRRSGKQAIPETQFVTSLCIQRYSSRVGGGATCVRYVHFPISISTPPTTNEYCVMCLSHKGRDSILTFSIYHTRLGSRAGNVSITSYLLTRYQLMRLAFARVSGESNTEYTCNVAPAITALLVTILLP
jgi:hypothetical protein